MTKKRIMILGCTGSIGTTALKTLDSLRDSFEIVAISAHTDLSSLLLIAEKFRVNNVCLTGKNDVDVTLFGSKNFYLMESGLLEMIRLVECDIVLQAISGSSALRSTFACIESHKNIALANKESIVMGGNLLFNLAKNAGVNIFPVDSEHSTLDALIRAHGKNAIDSLVITASGGPFKNYKLVDLEGVTLDDALKHPTWSMGQKITVDSATLANKGLEVIEASYLFNMDEQHIEVVIHPQSIVHSLIRMKNGALYAQLSPPDMALPIMNAINNNYIELQNIVSPLNFTSLSLTFEKYDELRFPILKDAFRCVTLKGGYPIAFNGANEVAVEAFIQGDIPFHLISSVVHEVLETNWSTGASDIEGIFLLHEKAMVLAKKVVKRWCDSE